MSKRIKTTASQGRDYERMLKDYFGFHLYGMEVNNEGGQVQAQVVYMDFKHVDTVRRELAQMMPEVEFIKLRRNYTDSAVIWELKRLMWHQPTPSNPVPVIYVQRGDALVRTTIYDIATAELRQLELDEDDDKEICYTDYEMTVADGEELRRLSWD